MRRLSSVRSIAPDALERTVQVALVEYLRMVLPREWMTFAIKNEYGGVKAKGNSPQEQGKRARFFAKRKAEGVVTGWPDLGIVSPGGVVYWVETKRPKGGVLSTAQQDVHQHMTTYGIRVGVANSIESLRGLCQEWGLPLREAEGQPVELARVRKAPKRNGLPADEVLF